MLTSKRETSLRELRVRADELSPVLGDLDGNVIRIGAAIERAVVDGVQLLVLPELATSGYYLDSTEAALDVSLTSDSSVFSNWASLLPTGMVVVVGFAERLADVAYNSAVVLSSEGVHAVYRKVHLWDQEKNIFAAGADRQPVVKTPIGQIGVLICYDLEFPEVPRALALRGAEILVVPTNWPLVARPAGEHPPEIVQAMAAARASAITIVCCDRGGIESGKVWTEGTAVIGSDGWVIGGKKSHTVDATVVIDPASAQISAHNHVMSDRRPDHYGALSTEG
jgi:predicted amidohydrolase